MSKQDAKGRSQSAPMAVKQVDIAARYPRRFWLAFWALADEQRVHLIVHELNHYVWRGPLDELARPVFMPAGGTPLLARDAAWTYEGRRLGRRKALAPACDHPLCIRPEHQRVVRVTKRDSSLRNVTERHEARS